MHNKLNSILSLLVLYIVCTFEVQAEVVEGTVNIGAEPAFAANVYFKHHLKYYAITDEDGGFVLQYSPIEVVEDTLVVSYLGCSIQEFPAYQIKIPLNICLSRLDCNLSEIVIKTDPVLGREFSVQKLTRFDIYMDPFASADPLKSISLCSYCTSSSESANPELRGSSAVLSKVFLNGVPIDNPVRNQQLNNMGNFSLFNAEIVGCQYVYPSNPPLNLGHSISGVVDVRTTDEITADAQTQLSLSLAQAGVMHSHKLGNQGFVQLYSNTQHSALYKEINSNNLDYLRNFSSVDAGVNARWHFGSNSYINLYSYYIREQFKSDKGQYNYYGTMQAGNWRQFNIVNWLWKSKSTVVSVNGGIDQSHSLYSFGYMKDTTDVRMGYLSATLKQSIGEKLAISAGGDMTYYRYRYLQTSENHSAEPFFNFRYLSESLWQVSLCLRGHFYERRTPQLSFSVHLRKDFGEKGDLKLAYGKYHTQLQPGYYLRNISQINSTQATIDYRYHCGKLEINSSLYAKEEHTPVYCYLVDNPMQANNRIVGIELAGSYQIHPLAFKCAFCYIVARMRTLQKEYHSYNDGLYILKANLNYVNSKVCNLSLSYIARPGLYYTPCGGKINSQRIKAYQRLDFTANRYFKMGKIGIIPYFSATNLLNRHNVQHYYFSEDYSQQFEQLNQGFLLYFGTTLSF